MNKPTIDEILAGLRASLPEGEEEPNRFTAVMVAAKRARHINSYYRQLGEGGGFDDSSVPLLPGGTRNYLSVAMEEIARGEVTYRIR